MARSAEKAMTALARWRAVFVDKVQDTKRRPYLASECDSLRDSLRFRKQILAEVSRKVAQIQNAGLGEFKLRDLNDEINKLLREKGHWEDRIKQLGGPDFRRTGPRMFDYEGKEAPGGSRGYRYFGAARDLPGVRELFEADPAPPPRKSRAELMKYVDVDYYGYRDEDDDVILPQEAKREREFLEQKREQWRKRRAQNMLDDAEEENIYRVDSNPADEEMDRLYEVLDEPMVIPGDSGENETESSVRRFVSHVPVPSQAEVEAALVARKKTELLERYASAEMMEEAAATRRMLGHEVEGAASEEAEEEEESDEEVSQPGSAVPEIVVQETEMGIVTCIEKRDVSDETTVAKEGEAVTSDIETVNVNETTVAKEGEAVTSDIETVNVNETTVAKEREAVTSEIETVDVNETTVAKEGEAVTSEIETVNVSETTVAKEEEAVASEIVVSVENVEDAAKAVSIAETISEDKTVSEEMAERKRPLSSEENDSPDKIPEKVQRIS